MTAVTPSSTTTTALTVVQVLPALNAGGVERGTVEFARELAAAGHRSIVVSNGGRQVERLQAEGSEHISLPVHRKSLRSFAQVRPMRRLLRDLQPDIVHVRSRIPAWITWLAWRRLPAANRPGLVSTFHGLYSVTPYSAIMGCGERVIAISDCVHQYVLENYPKIDPSTITRIYRGLDQQQFRPQANLTQWRNTLEQEFPRLRGKRWVLMPGRLSRWKGQEDFLQMMQTLVRQHPDCHGIILGEAEPDKAHYRAELESLSAALGLKEQVTFVGHREDIQAFYACAAVTCHMSSKAEPFGRTMPEAMACGCPVVAYDRGGASESLARAFPQGLTVPDDPPQFAQCVSDVLAQPAALTLPPEFYLDHQVSQTLAVYHDLLRSRRS